MSRSQLHAACAALVLVTAASPAASAMPGVAARDSALAAERSAAGYDGAGRSRACASAGVRAALAESLATSAPGAAGERERVYADAIRALRAAAGGPADPGALAALRHGAEDLGDPRAAQLLGQLYASGERVAPDDSLAVHYLLLATRQGDCRVAPSFALLAHAYFRGAGIARSDSLAGRAMNAAYFGAADEACRAAYGDRDLWVARQGLFFVAGESRLHGEGVHVDVPSSMYQFDKGARFGEAACALRAAMLFLPPPVGDPQAIGRVQPDAERARGYLQQAHDAGVPVASLLLARCLAEGIGGAADPGRALTLFEQAAANGLPHARLELATRLAGGEGVPFDSLRGRRELERAARESDPRAMSIVGSLAYERALADHTAARPRRLAEAAAWFERAAAGGDGTAMYALGVMHRNGQHYSRDLGKAAAWFERARSAGVTGAR